jgi:hypothetical protein
MKIKILLLISVFLMSACGNDIQKNHEYQAMQGIQVEGQMSAYTRMCMRTPDSVLCPQDDFFVTNSKSLNQQWCDLCAKDSSYSWCSYFPECVVEQKPSPMPISDPKGETMQGRVVRIRARAYEDMCNRTPDSVLCN